MNKVYCVFNDDGIYCIYQHEEDAKAFVKIMEKVYKEHSSFYYTDMQVIDSFGI